MKFFCIVIILLITAAVSAEERPNSVGLQFSSFSGLSAAYRHYFPKRFGVELHGWSSEKREVKQFATGMGGMLLFRLDRSSPGEKRRRMLYAFFSIDSEYNKTILEEYYVIDPGDYASDMGTRERIDSRLAVDYGPGVGFNIGRVVVLSVNISYGFNRITTYDDTGLFKGDSGFRLMVGTMYDFSFRLLGDRMKGFAKSEKGEEDLL